VASYTTVYFSPNLRKKFKIYLKKRPPDAVMQVFVVTGAN
jgi:hypothetical protein